MSNEVDRRKARVIAFYLPQFHPIRENDEWWGKGFTEWTNVARAKPLFKGHEQPHLPADLGFYDLRLPEVRAAQAEMAANYGVEGFCYWHYWFGGRRLLERPFNEVLASGEPNFPFCLGWANESWTGVWNNEPRRMLMEQTYPGEADDRAHFDYLLKAFGDHRYITVDGRPLLFIYKPLKLPDAERQLDRWREWAHQAGLKGLYILGNNMLDFEDAAALGLDGAVVSTLGVITTKNAMLNKAQWLFWGVSKKVSLGGPRIIEYREAIQHLVPDLSKFQFDAYPCVYPNWDHSPRSGRKGLVLTGSNPDLFERHVKDAVAALRARDDEHRIVFLKSWNEWAEGNYIEPDTRWGHAYLQALRRALWRD
ncbi:glycoside hydrolase family 99-like domain-containing protein [Denitromonas sp.]|uniref:glycosyltransferase WbsX family protein n=1 Tax=Denitromonas sp. TaxID=2734609 RepID=UPI002AFF1CA0|nr:glycoside hydrolase family 99-like domain-containing protein [Denitromonas sp.]